MPEQKEIPKELWDFMLKVKIQAALAYWARKKLGTKYERFLEQGLFYFFYLIAKQTQQTGDRFKAFKDTPLFIPSRLRADLLPTEADSEVKSFAERARKIKSKKYRNPVALNMAFRDNFPGMPNARIARWVKLKPTEIARDYVAWKYKVPSHAALKKRLYQYSEKQIIQTILREAEALN